MTVADVQLPLTPVSTRDPEENPAPPASDPGGYRWLICCLLFFAGTVNYMDRQVIGLLKPTLQIQFGWTEVGYSNIVLAFQLAYAIGLLFVGKLIDRLRARKGFSLGGFVWGFAALVHGA